MIGLTEYTATINATEYPQEQRQQVIFETFRKLQPRETMLLIHDQNPNRLHFHFNVMHAGEFTWDYLEQGPEKYRVMISKIER